MSITAICLALVACNKDKTDSGSTQYGAVTDIRDLKVPDSFNWSSSKNLTTDISVVGIEGIPMSRVRVDIYDKDAYEGGKVLWSGFTNKNGRLEAPIKLPTSLTEVVVHAKVVGVGDNRITASTRGNKITAHFSGEPGSRIFKKNSATGYEASFTASVFGDTLWHLGPYNALGVPAGMSSVPVSQAYIDHLNLMLPENNNLPCDPVRKHFLDDLFCNQVTTSKDNGDVYVTFLTEGAGFKNALAYYSYPAGSPPAGPGSVGKVNIIFPNATHANNNLQPGDRVHLGKFPKNTTIEWVLLGDMWDNVDQEVEYGNGKTYIYFGEDGFNADMGINEPGCPDPAFNQHMISLTDTLNGEEIQIFSFEDLRYPGGDFDFNDCIFYASGDIYQSCAPSNVLPGNSITDSDGDGIIDQLDDEPNNPNVACLINYQGTLMFEDLWPSQGDYDFNDLVTTYDITHAIHANGYVHEVRADYKIKAAGAGFNNGFGTVLSDDIVKSDIASITGRNSIGTYPMDGDLQASGGDVVMYNWDATKDLITNDIQAGQFFNTSPGGGQGSCVEEHILITMNDSAVNQWELGLPPYNPFIFARGVQDWEIHLADMPPSTLNDNSRFGTKQDDSNIGLNTYYKTVPATKLPWGLDIPANMSEWPLERVDILQAFPQFGVWASTSGASNTTWYLNPDLSKIYNGCP